MKRVFGAIAAAFLLAGAAHAQIDTVARGLGAKALAQQGLPATQISVTDPQFGVLTLTAPGASAPSAGVMTANTAVLNTILSRYCIGTGAAQLSQSAAYIINFPGYIIDINGSLDARVKGGTWGCRLEGVPGNTILRQNATATPGLLIGGHGQAIKGITVWYNNVSSSPSPAELSNTGNAGSNCFEVWAAVSFSYSQMQCYGGVRGWLLPWADASAYGSGAGRNVMFSGTITDIYNATNLYRHMDLAATSNWAGTATVSSGTTLTINSTTNAGGNTLSTGMSIFCVGWSTGSTTTISSGSGTSWVISQSQTNAGPVACTAGKLNGNGTPMSLTDIYATNNGLADGSTALAALNMGYLFYGMSVSIRNINDERGYPGAIATPIYGQGGDGNAALGEIFISQAPNCQLDAVHFEGTVFKANNMGLFASTSNTICFVRGVDTPLITATTALGATNLYVLRPFGLTNLWNIQGLIDAGSVGSLANNVTNPIGLVYTGNTLTTSAIKFGPIMHQSTATIADTQAVVPSNDAAIFSRDPPGTTTVYSTAGSFTFTPRLDANYEDVFVCGSGGGGGSGAQETLGTVGSGGGGGGGAACLRKVFSRSDLGSTVAITVGTGGAGGIATTGTGNGNVGQVGTSSTFGTLLTGYAGGGGGGGITAAVSAGGGSGGCSSVGGSVSANSSTAGTAGVGGGNAGGSGTNGSTSGASFLGGAGGSGATTSAAVSGVVGFYCPGGASGGTLLVGSATPGGTGGAVAGQTGASGGTSGGGVAGGNGVALTASQTGGAGGGGGSATGAAGGSPGTSATCAGGSGSGAGAANGVAGAKGGDGLVVIREG